MFELRHLRYFIAVAEELNFTRAAARLHTAQPSLSQQIRQLEEWVGTPLLRRDKHHVELTPAGQVMLTEARTILQKTGEAVRNALAAADENSKQIIIGMNPCAEVKVIPSVLHLFKGRFPEIHVLLHSLPILTDQIDSLRNRTIDIGFMRKIEDSADLATETVLKEEILVLLPANHSLAQFERIPLNKLLAIPYIGVGKEQGPNLHAIIESFCARERIQFRHIQDSQNLYGAINMVGANLGFTLAPDYVRRILPKHVVALPLDCPNPPTIELVCAYHRGDLSSSLSSFLTILREFIEKNRQ